MEKIITIANRKGGVGKTTTAYMIGCFLAKLPYKTLLIDLDAQGSLTSLISNNSLEISNNINIIYRKYQV